MRYKAHHSSARHGWPASVRYPSMQTHQQAPRRPPLSLWALRPRRPPLGLPSPPTRVIQARHSSRSSFRFLPPLCFSSGSATPGYKRTAVPLWRFVRLVRSGPAPAKTGPRWTAARDAARTPRRRRPSRRLIAVWRACLCLTEHSSVSPPSPRGNNSIGPRERWSEAA